MSNTDIANKLQAYARDLRQRHENLFRVKAYRRAAEIVLRLRQPVQELVHARGKNALAEVPGIGKHLAETIAVYIQTGEWRARH